MQKCPTCSSDNLLISEYCERCGFPLKTSRATMSSDIEYTIPSMRMPPPPPPPLSAPPYSYPPIIMPPPANTYQPSPNAKVRSSRTVGNTMLGVLLYLIGASSTALGTFGGLQNAVGASWATACLISTLLISIAVLIIALARRRSMNWRWWQRLLGWIGITIGMITFTFSSYAFLLFQAKGIISPLAEDILLGSCFIIYGLATMFQALK